MKYHKNAFIYAPQGIYMRTLLGIHGYPKVPTFDPDFDSVKKKAERYACYFNRNIILCFVMDRRTKSFIEIASCLKRFLKINRMRILLTTTAYGVHLGPNASCTVLLPY